MPLCETLLVLAAHQTTTENLVNLRSSRSNSIIIDGLVSLESLSLEILIFLNRGAAKSELLKAKFNAKSATVNY